MRYLKYISIIMTGVMMLSCSGRPKFAFSSFEKIANGKNSLLISCLRCSCVDQELEYIHKTAPGLLDKYNIITDTTCLPSGIKSLPVTHLPKEFQDSLSGDIYNLLIINIEKRNVRLVTTEKMKNLSLLLK